MNELKKTIMIILAICLLSMSSCGPGLSDWRIELPGFIIAHINANEIIFAQNDPLSREYVNPINDGFVEAYYYNESVIALCCAKDKAEASKWSADQRKYFLVMIDTKEVMEFRGQSDVEDYVSRTFGEDITWTLTRPAPAEAK